MLDQLVAPTLEAFDRAELELHQSMSDHAVQMTELLNDILGAWRQDCEKVLRGDKPTPDPVETKKLLGSLLRASRRGFDVFPMASSFLSDEINGLKEMHHAFAKIERLHARLMARWHTLEDLEDIAAEELALTAEQLDEVATRYGFPQAWYDENSKPF